MCSNRCTYNFALLEDKSLYVSIDNKGVPIFLVAGMFPSKHDSVLFLFFRNKILAVLRSFSFESLSMIATDTVSSICSLAVMAFLKGFSAKICNWNL